MGRVARTSRRAAQKNFIPLAGYPPRFGRYDGVMDVNEVNSPGKLLLSIIELGGYPNFAPLYRELGYEVVVETRMRKAIGFLKRRTPDVIVAEFNFQSDFRDRTSSLESLLAVVQRRPEIRVIVFYEQEYLPQFEILRARLPVHHALAFPVDKVGVRACLLAADNGI
jgi:hypothetical protein